MNATPGAIVDTEEGKGISICCDKLKRRSRQPEPSSFHETSARAHALERNMGFVWVHAESFLRSLASPLPSSVTTCTELEISTVTHMHVGVLPSMLERSTSRSRPEIKL